MIDEWGKNGYYIFFYILFYSCRMIMWQFHWTPAWDKYFCFIWCESVECMVLLPTLITDIDTLQVVTPAEWKLSPMLTQFYHQLVINLSSLSRTTIHRNWRWFTEYSTFQTCWLEEVLQIHIAFSYFLKHLNNLENRQVISLPTLLFGIINNLYLFSWFSTVMYLRQFSYMHNGVTAETKVTKKKSIIQNKGDFHSGFCLFK